MKDLGSSYYWCIGILLLSVACNSSRSDETEKNEPKTEKVYSNPVLDRNFPDPTVIEAPDRYYYAYGTNSSVNGKTINIQVIRSKDLINWEDMGDALPQKPVWAYKDFWAPHVFYDTINQTYYLYYSGESTSEEYGKCLGVATSKSPVGPFVDKGAPMLCSEGFIDIDPMAYDDPVTGKKLLYWGSGHEAIKVQELEDDRMSFKAGSEPIEVIQPIMNDDPNNYQRLVEGAWVVHREGYYYMFYAGDNCCGEHAHYAVMVARSENATGPFETLAEATGEGNSTILVYNDRWIAPGHNSIITDKAGQDWIVYHAIDAEDPDKGRVMLIDAITYEDGWPRIKEGVPSVAVEKVPVVDQGH